MSECCKDYDVTAAEFVLATVLAERDAARAELRALREAHHDECVRGDTARRERNAAREKLECMRIASEACKETVPRAVYDIICAESQRLAEQLASTTRERDAATLQAEELKNKAVAAEHKRDLLQCRLNDIAAATDNETRDRASAANWDAWKRACAERDAARLELEGGRLHWTTTAPTVPGFYWFRVGDRSPCVEHVWDDGAGMGMFVENADYGDSLQLAFFIHEHEPQPMQWAGPIPEPIAPPSDSAAKTGGGT